MADPKTMNSDQYAKLIAVLRLNMDRALKAARETADNASEFLAGTPGCILFNDARKAIADLNDHPALKALKTASIPPATLADTKD